MCVGLWVYTYMKIGFHRFMLKPQVYAEWVEKSGGSIIIFFINYKVSRQVYFIIIQCVEADGSTKEPLWHQVVIPYAFPEWTFGSLVHDYEISYLECCS